MSSIIVAFEAKNSLIYNWQCISEEYKPEITAISKTENTALQAFSVYLINVNIEVKLLIFLNLKLILLKSKINQQICDIFPRHIKFNTDCKYR